MPSTCRREGRVEGVGRRGLGCTVTMDGATAGRDDARAPGGVRGVGGGGTKVARLGEGGGRGGGDWACAVTHLGDEKQRGGSVAARADSLVHQRGDDGREAARAGDDARRALRHHQLPVVHDDHRRLEAVLEEATRHAEQQARHLHRRRHPRRHAAARAAAAAAAATAHERRALHRPTAALLLRGLQLHALAAATGATGRLGGAFGQAVRERRAQRDAHQHEGKRDGEEGHQRRWQQCRVVRPHQREPARQDRAGRHAQRRRELEEHEQVLAATRVGLGAGALLGGVAGAEAERHDDAAREQVVQVGAHPLDAEEGEVADEQKGGEDERGQLALDELRWPRVHDDDGDDHAERARGGDGARSRQRRGMSAILRRRQCDRHDDRDAQVDEKRRAAPSDQVVERVRARDDAAGRCLRGWEPTDGAVGGRHEHARRWWV